MARQASSGQPRQVNVVLTDPSVSTTYQISTDDDYIAIGTGFTGGTIVLPGPANDSHNDPPNAGDQYTICDPLGLVTSGHTITINGGGYQFLSGGSLVSSATYDTIALSAGEGLGESTGMKFTFIPLGGPDVGGVWAVEW